MKDMTYWYFVYVYRAKGKMEYIFESDVFAGAFSELVLHIHEQTGQDKHYTNFHLVNWNAITQETFNRLDGVLG